MTLCTHSLTLKPPAKINLSLVVFAPRADGYHGLHSVMTTIDLCDRLEISRAQQPGLTLNCTGLPSPDGPENLVYRAAQRLQQYTGRQLALEITLHKEIPAGAGLGGASSDAAAAMVGIDRLLDLGLTGPELSQLAGQIGSDVPFFLHAPAALCTGRGETVQPLEQRCHQSLLLIMPGLHVPTAQVYQQYQPDPAQSDKQLKLVRQCLDTDDLDQLAQLGINSLTQPCIQLFPQLEQLRRRIEAAGIAPLHMAGSGSTLYAVANEQETQSWAHKLPELNVADFKVVKCHQQQTLFPEVHHADF